MNTRENLYTPNCIRTFTGKYVNPVEPDIDLICIEDIAHSLSMQPRFGGHLPTWYSVAEHSMDVCAMAPTALKLEALMHDASEAYLLDVPSPIKNRLINYKAIENNLMRVIASKFGFTCPLSKDIKKLDEVQLQWEWDNIMINPEVSYFLTPQQAYNRFLDTFYSLTPSTTQQ